MDDEVDTAGSMVGASEALINAGAKEVYACATHGLLSDPAPERIANSPIQELIITDTVPIKSDQTYKKFKIISIAPLFGEAIKRIHDGKSVGALFAH